LTSTGNLPPYATAPRPHQARRPATAGSLRRPGPILAQGPRKSEASQPESPLAEKPQALDFDPRGGGELHPEAFREDTGPTDLPELGAFKRRAAVEPQPAPRPVRKAKPTGPAKLFVLDTNVLMHDPMSLFRFEEHDIFLPMIVLEELDGHKKGMTEVARNARQASRTLDALAGAQGRGYRQRPEAQHHGPPRGSRQSVLPDSGAGKQPAGQPAARQGRQPDLGVVQSCASSMRRARWCWCPRTSTCASRRARSAWRPTTTRTTRRSTTWTCCIQARWPCRRTSGTKHGKTIESWQSGQHTFYRITGPVVPSLLINQFVYFESPGEPSLYARVTEIRGQDRVLKTLKDYGHLKNSVWGVCTRNREQNFAMNLLMDPRSTSSRSPARPAPARR
jgi:PhoH-like ATPase